MASLTTESKSVGIVYCAMGEEYEAQAYNSYQSVLQKSPHLKATLFSNGSNQHAIWDNVITPEIEYQLSKQNQMLPKLDAILSSPYEKSLFLDSDTLILDDLTELYLLLEKFDLVLCHGHNRGRRFNLIQNARSDKGGFLFSDAIPYCFAPLQSGLMLYNKAATHDFFRNVKELYLKKNYYDDQASIRELLWDSNLRFYILPPEYNFNSLAYLKSLRRSYFAIAYPKVFHYTLNKMDNPRLLKRKLFRLSKPKKYSLRSVLKLYFRKRHKQELGP